MPDKAGPASEFGGKVQQNRVQPLPHVPTASERLMLVYTTGSEDGVNPFTGMRAPDGDESFQGLLPFKVQKELRKQAGDLDKGEVWETMVQDAGS